MIPAIWGLALVILTIGVCTIMSMQRLAASVAALTTVAASATNLLSNLAEQIRETAGDEDASNQLADSIDESTTELSAAITANTIADGADSPNVGTGTGAGNDQAQPAESPGAQAESASPASDQPIE